VPSQLCVCPMDSSSAMKIDSEIEYCLLFCRYGKYLWLTHCDEFTWLRRKLLVPSKRFNRRLNCHSKPSISNDSDACKRSVPTVPQPKRTYKVWQSNKKNSMPVAWLAKHLNFHDDISTEHLVHVHPSTKSPIIIICTSDQCSEKHKSSLLTSGRSTEE
jgi:hypothetical protein